MPAHVLLNPIPREMVILSAETVDRITEACAAAALITVVSTADQLRDADLAVKYLNKMAKQISDGRLELTRPMDDLKRQAIAAQEEGCAPLLSRARTIQGIIKSYTDEETRLYNERLRLAEIERQRLQAIADAEAKARLDAMQAEMDASTPPDVPKQEISPASCLPATVHTNYVPPPPRSSSTRAHTNFSLEYIDGSKVPVISPQGIMLRPIDEAKLKAYLKTLPEGKREIAGAVRLVEIETTANKG